MAEEAKSSVKRLTEKQRTTPLLTAWKKWFRALRVTVKIRFFHFCYAEKEMCYKLGEYLLNFIFAYIILYHIYYVRDYVREGLYSLF